MKITSYFLICSQLFSLSFGYLQLQIKSRDKNNSLCFTVGSPEESNRIPAAPEIALVLQVSYPLSIAEAGQIILKDLQLGLHNVTYKYAVTNMTHGLQVFLDGEEKKFLKSDVPRWYSVSTFSDVSFMTQGNVEIGCKESKIIFQNVANFSSNNETVTNLSNKPYQNQSIEESIQENAGKYILETESNTTLSSISNKFPSSVNSKKLQNNYENLQNSQQNTTDTVTQEYVTLISPSYWDMNAIRTERSSQCINGQNCDSSDRDYTLAYVLLGILGGLVFFAIVISLVFHKKKKKYLRAPPNNRMHQLYENSNLTGESKLIVDQLTNHIQEQQSGT